MLTIDGSMGEGGGQVLRTATGLAALVRRPVKVQNIRADRPKPGLMAQHIRGIKALCRLTGGEADGLDHGSAEILFTPGASLKTRLEIDIGTAGSTTLLLQGVILALAGSGRRVRLTLRGGTDVRWSPPFMYFAHVLVPLLTGMGFSFQARLLVPGFYPKGGGLIEVAVRAPHNLQPLVPKRGGEPVRVHAFAVASDDLGKARVAERLVRGAREVYPELKGNTTYGRSLSTGCSVVLAAAVGGAVIGADSLGERGVRAEQVGARAAEDLQSQLRSGCTVDRWASDQVLPFMALARGRSTVAAPELTSHARTNMEVARLFLDTDFEAVEEGGRATIACSGFRGFRA